MSATYSNRQKIKVDDFKFVIRSNETMLGRVQELLGMDKELKDARRQLKEDMAEGKALLEKTKEGDRPKGKRGRKPKNWVPAEEPDE
jgi:transcription initiation factor TFIID subunit 13